MTTAPDCLAINKGICSASMPGENLAGSCTINKSREDSKVMVPHRVTIN